MQVLCVASNNPADKADAVCPVCNQAYAVYFSRTRSAECEQALAEVRATLVAQHGADRTPAAHPAQSFNVPEWRGAAEMSAAALLGGAPATLHAAVIPVVPAVADRAAA